jgi:hypothetical protein
MKDSDEEVSLAKRVLEVAVCGHRVSTAEMVAVAAARQRLQTSLFIFKVSLCSFQAFSMHSVKTKERCVHSQLVVT